MDVNDTIALITKAAKSFQKKHVFKEYMPVRNKKDLLPSANFVGVFICKLTHPITGTNDSPLHHDNFMVADCVVAGVAVDGSISIGHADSRFLEPIIEDDSQLQWELPLDAKQ